jgi:hypothetical protein
MEDKNRKSLYRLFFFLHPSSHGTHPLSSILQPRFSILLLLAGILLAGIVITHAGGITAPASKSQSLDFDLHADALPSNLKNDYLPESDPHSSAPASVVEQDQTTKELGSAKLLPEAAKADPPLEGTPDLPPDVPMPESTLEPKIVVEDVASAKGLPPVQERKPEPEPTKDVPAVEEKPDAVKEVTTENTDSEAQSDLDDTYVTSIEGIHPCETLGEC